MSFEGDAHLPFVTRHLDSWGVPWLLIPTRDFGEAASVSLRPGRSPDVRLRVEGRSVDVSDLRVIWNRRLLRAVLPNLLEDPSVYQYAQEQWWAAVNSAIRAASARWINDPAALDAARDKPDQISVAAKLGLTVPPTLVSSDALEVQEFAASLSMDLVTKVVSPGSPIVAPGIDQYMVFTQPVDLDAVDPRSLEVAPAIYQPRINKVLDVRISIVGDDLYACAIRSQDRESTKLDWRRDVAGLVHEAIDVPARIVDQLRSLCRHYGLVYGMADMVVDENGEWVFLELNPNGQWAWVEERTGLPIGESLARVLVDA